MAETYVRVDDRLIHGQTIVAWVPMLRVKEIIGVDDVSAANPTLRSILTMGVPKQYKTHIVTSDEAKALLAQEGEMNRLVIVKTPHTLFEIKDALVGCKHVYLGNMAKRPDTNHQMAGATGIFFLSDQDIAEIGDMARGGFDISFQQLPNTQERSWDSFTRTL